MKHRSEHTQKQEQQLHEQVQSAQEFKSSDELLRFDAAQTPVPPEIAHRLKKSAAEMTKATVADSRPWWKKMVDSLKRSK